MNSKRIRIIFFIAFLAYILIVLRLTIFRTGTFDERQLNLAIFADLIHVFRNVGVGRFLWLFFGNIGWFVPFGFLLPVLLKRESFLKVIVIGLMFSLTIESLQFIFRVGVAELDDLILNTLGTAIGYLLFKFTSKRFLADMSKDASNGGGRV